MHKLKVSIAGIAFVAAAVAIGVGGADASPVVFSASGATPADIQGTVDAYRVALGTLNPNVAGSFGSGRREINWDGVPDLRSAPNDLPANFFNVNSPRGAVFSTPGTGFEVSANAGIAPVEFGNLDPSYPAEFQVFSPQRLFTAIGSNILDVNFFIPGSTTAALTRGFGSVFTDVDLGGVTSIAFFDVSNTLLDTFFVSPSTDGGLSFLGVDYGTAVVARVRITSGNAALAGPELTQDLVVMDDFIYGEPVTIPEPASLVLLGLGLAGLGVARSRRAARIRV